MRPGFVVPSLAVALAGLAAAAGAEVTRTLTLELTGDPAQAFAVENLVGRMSVVPGTGKRVVAVATVHAESSAVADQVRFERVQGEGGVPTLRVRYPLDRHKTIRHGEGGASEGFLAWLGLDGSRIEYDGADVRVSRHDGVRVWADVEVRLPAGAIDGRFDNRVGPVDARSLQGKVSLRTRNGDVTVRDSSGDLSMRSGSGRVAASTTRGSVDGSTGSGECEITDFEGREARCRTGSGNVRIARVKAGSVRAGTGSGDVQVDAADAQELEAKTGSGDVHFDVQGTRLQRVTARTGSGDVGVKLARGVPFELRARTGSGDVESRAADAEAVRSGRKVVGYRRGQGGADIDVTTGSGDVTVE